MNAKLAYICTNCGEIEQRCPQGKCEHCGSANVFPLAKYLPDGFAAARDVEQTS